MSITIVDSEFLLNPVRNPVRFEVSTDAYLTLYPAAATMTLIFDGADIPLAGDFMVLAWNGLSVQFLFTNTPTNPTDIRAYASGTLVNWVINEVVPVLQAHYQLSTDFHIEQQGLIAQIGFTAYNTGSAYDITCTPTGFAFDTNIPNAGSDGTTEPNFVLVVQVWVEQGYNTNTFQLVLEEEYKPSDNATLVGNIAKVLRAYVQAMYPSPSTVSGAQLSDQFTRFYLRFAEKYGDPAVVVGQVTTGNTRWAYLAGTSEPDRIQWQNDGGWIFYATPNAESRFLSAWPNTTEGAAKWVLAEQREHLAYVVPFGITSGRLRADIYYHDGSSELLHIIEALGDWDQYELWLAHVGVEARGLDAVHPTKTISHYCVYLTSGSSTTVISERRWFRVRYDHVDNFRQLHYLNSRGGWDTMPLYGPRVQAIEVDKVASERFDPSGDRLEEVRDRATTFNRFNDQFEAGTCMLRPDEMEAYKELLASEAVVERFNGQHWPVEVLNDKGDGIDENEQLTGRVVQYRYALRNTAHS